MPMTRRFKSFIPKRIRSAFGHAVIRAAQIETLVRRIDLLERAVAELSPEIVQVSPEVDAVIQAFVCTHDLQGLDVAVLFSEDAALKPDAYGMSSVNEAYVANVVAALRSGRWRYWRYSKALHQRQDLYILSRDPLDDCSHIPLPRFAGI